MLSFPALLAAAGTSILTTGVWLIIVGLRPAAPPPAGHKPLSRRSFEGWSTLSSAVLKRAAAAVLCGVAVLGVTGWPVAALAGAVAGWAVPRIVTGGTAAERIRRLEALEQWTRRLSDLLAAGRGLEQAVQHSASRNLPVAIAAAVNTLARRITVMRMPTEQALRLFAEELDDPVADRIAAALILVARRRGSGASAVLEGLAELVAHDVADRREVEAARAEHRTTVRWVIGILVVLTAAAVLQHSYVQPFDTAIGQLVLALVVACYAGALWWLHQLGTPEPSRRFLSSVERG